MKSSSERAPQRERWSS